MATNFNKVGYSTTEVAQMLKCTPTTVRAYIYSKKLEALGSEDRIARDHRRTLRITRESLAKFLSENRNKYPKELVAQFVKDNISYEEAKSKSGSEYGILAEDLWPPKGSYTAESVQELKGAYADTDSVKESKRLEESEVSKRLENALKITINGSTIKYITKSTAQKIVSALLEDESFELKTIMIWGDNK